MVTQQESWVSHMVLVEKNPPDNAGDARYTAGSERSPGEENGNPLQYSCLEKSHGWRSLVGYSPWSGKESDRTECLSMHKSKKLMRKHKETCQGWHPNIYLL